MKRLSAWPRCVLMVILTLGITGSAVAETLARSPKQPFLRQLIIRVLGELSSPPGQPKP